MNWLVLLLIIEPLAINWAAPIELLAINNEFQSTANNLTEMRNDLQNTTESAFDLSLLGANLEDQKDRENLSESERIRDESTEQIIATREHYENLPTSSQKPNQSSTDILNDFQETTKSNNDKNIASVSTMGVKSAIKKAASELENSQKNIPVYLIHDDYFSSFPLTTKYTKKFVEVTKNKTIIESKNKTELSTSANLKQAIQQPRNTSEETSQESRAEMNPHPILEDLNGNFENVFTHSREFIENITKNDSKQLETSSTSEHVASSHDPETVSSSGRYLKDFIAVSPNEKETTNSSHFVENFNKISKQISEFTLFPQKAATQNPQETTDQIADLNEANDSSSQQILDVDQRDVKATKELVLNTSSKMQFLIENPPSSDLAVFFNKSLSEPEVPTDLKEQEEPVHAPTFKQAVDSFIESVSEIGSEIQLNPVKVGDDQAPTTTDFLSEKLNQACKLSADLNTTNFEQPTLDSFDKELSSFKSEENLLNKTTETATETTPPLWENVKENLYTKQEDDAKSSGLSKSFENFIGSASVNLEKAVSKLLTTNQNLEYTTSSPNENSTESSNREDQHPSQVSSSQSPLETLIKVSSTTLIEDKQQTEIFTTTQMTNANLRNPKKFAESVNENVWESQENDKHIQVTGEVALTGPTQQDKIVTHYDTTTLNEEFKTSEKEQLVVENKQTEINDTSIKAEVEGTITTPKPVSFQTFQAVTKNSDVESQENIIEQNFSEVVTKHDIESAEYSKLKELDEQNNFEGNIEPVSEFQQHGRFPITEKMSKEVKLEPGEIETTSISQQPEITTHLDTEILKEGTTALKKEPQKTENKQFEIKESGINDQSSSTNMFNETSQTTTINELNETEDYTTSSQIVYPNAQDMITEAAQETNKFENENLKPEETYHTTLENTQFKATTFDSRENSLLYTTLVREFTTLAPLEETKVVSQQTDANPLETTTHHYIEELKSNVKQYFNKLTIAKAAQESLERDTTLAMVEEISTEPVTAQKYLREQTTTTKPEVSARYVLEERHHSDVIGDVFYEKYQNPKDITTTVAQDKNVKTQFLEQNIENSSIVFTTVLPPNEQNESLRYNEDITTTTQNAIQEGESTSEAETAATEYIAETTSSPPILAAVPLHKDTNTNFLNTFIAPVTEVQTQIQQTEQLNETLAEVSTTMQPTQPMKETNTLPSFENSRQEMVTFIEHTDVTTKRYPFKDYKEEEEEPSATTHIQETLMQTSFMEEEQQQLESTTERNDTQSQSADASGQTDTTTTHEEQFEQQTTEAEIDSSTVAEQQDTTTTTTVTAAEPEARLLSLPPPKLEYLQSEDGVEVFYGYSIVKRN